MFIDTGLKLVFDEEGQLSAVDVTWAYDPLYTLLLLEDMRLDPDLDGVLEPAELEQLQGFDMKWIEGFEGDLYLEADGPVALAPPQPIETRMEGEKIVSVHRRPLETPMDVRNPVKVRPFDPGYFTAYAVTLDVGIEGGDGCDATLEMADIAAASDILEELLFTVPQAQLETDFPAVGEHFADTVTLTCVSG
ncbi:DUF1007 family protein [Cognatishimia sp. MH4019]|uniref:DUF1007 family protein n=1 Tax=Cognatishimia sp. MH4019 TaxID=2854030 RepID=UPI00351D5BAE